MLTSLILIGILFFKVSAEKQSSVDKNSKDKITVGLLKRDSVMLLNQNRVLKSFDLSIIENFGKKFNLQVDYLIVNKSVLNEIDIVLGVTDKDTLPHENFIASHSYYHDALTWCVQRKKQIPIWMNLFLLCNDPLIYGIYTVLCFAMVFLFYYLQQYEDVQPKWDWFRLTFSGICTTLGFPSEFRPQNIPSRIFFIFCIFGSMLFMIVVIAKTFAFATTPLYDKQIDSIREIVDESFDLIGDDFALQHLMQQNETYPLKMLETFKICDDINSCLSQLNHNAKLAVAISRERTLNLNLKSSSKFCFEYPDTIYEYPMTFSIRRHFPYLKDLNRFIQMASAGGLIWKWRVDNQIQAHYTIKDKTYQQLTLRNYYGFFILSCIILLIDLAILLLEIFAHKKARIPNPSRFWIIVEMIIDSDRHFWLENKRI